MKSNTRLKLKDILGTLSPADVDAMNARDIERVKEKIDKNNGNLLRELKALKKYFDGLHNTHETRFAKADVHFKEIGDNHAQLKKLLDKVNASFSEHQVTVQKMLDDHVKKNKQVIEEFQENTRNSYRKFLQREDY